MQFCQPSRLKTLIFVCLLLCRLCLWRFSLFGVSRGSVYLRGCRPSNGEQVGIAKGGATTSPVSIDVVRKSRMHVRPEGGTRVAARRLRAEGMELTCGDERSNPIRQGQELTTCRGKSWGAFGFLFSQPAGLKNRICSHCFSRRLWRDFCFNLRLGVVRLSLGLLPTRCAGEPASEAVLRIYERRDRDLVRIRVGTTLGPTQATSWDENCRREQNRKRKK